MRHCTRPPAHHQGSRPRCLISLRKCPRAAHSRRRNFILIWCSTRRSQRATFKIIAPSSSNSVTRIVPRKDKTRRTAAFEHKKLSDTKGSVCVCGVSGDAAMWKNQEGHRMKLTGVSTGARRKAQRKRRQEGCQHRLGIPRCGGRLCTKRPFSFRPLKNDLICSSSSVGPSSLMRCHGLRRPRKALRTRRAEAVDPSSGS